MKRPAFQFYPKDWLSDLGLRSLPVAARGLWADLMCLMHFGEPYGHLAVKGDPIDDETAARMVGIDQANFKVLLAEIESRGVSSRSDTGALYSRRMVKDEEIRAIRATSGRAGGRVSADSRFAQAKSKQASEQTTNQIVGGGEGEEEGSLGKGSGENQIAYLTRCVMALNRGLAANPHLTGHREVSTSEQQGRVTWERDGVPIDLAVRVIEAVATGFRPSARSRQPNSLRYFDDAVRRAHETPTESGITNAVDAAVKRLEQRYAS